MLSLKVEFKDGNSLTTRFNGTMEQAKAYARLIAAAPDLLEALMYSIKQVPELESVPGISAAIAKAKGEDQ